MTGLRRLAAILAACGTLALAAPAAQAAPDPQAQAPVRTAPAAPAGAYEASPSAHQGLRGPLAVLATSPYSSPNASAGHVAPGETYSCAVGNLCDLAWDPTVGKWELFRMYYCNRYYLYYWNGGGYFSNNQTSGTVARFYDQNGNTLRTDTAPTGQTYINWDPVYSIRNC